MVKILKNNSKIYYLNWDLLLTTHNGSKCLQIVVVIFSTDDTRSNSSSWRRRCGVVREADLPCLLVNDLALSSCSVCEQMSNCKLNFSKKEHRSISKQTNRKLPSNRNIQRTRWGTNRSLDIVELSEILTKVWSFVWRS